MEAKKETTRRGPRAGTQTSKIIEALRRKGGASLGEIVALTGWQKHTIRAFVSTLPKKAGLVITSTRRASDKARVYEAAR
jgi:DNA-binding IclR family transcriptional regulator